MVKSGKSSISDSKEFTSSQYVIIWQTPDLKHHKYVCAVGIYTSHPHTFVHMYAHMSINNLNVSIVMCADCLFFFLLYSPNRHSYFRIIMASLYESHDTRDCKDSKGVLSFHRDHILHVMSV